MESFIMDSNRQGKWGLKWIQRTVSEWQSKGEPSPPPQTVKSLMLANALKVSNFLRFIETGTLAGGTSGLMAQMPNVNVDTIEISKHYYDLSYNKLGGFCNVTRHFGDSAKILPSILDSLSEGAVFWLDAHYSGGNTGHSDLNAPISVELEHIINHSYTHFILIDDMHDFKGVNDYPHKDEIMDFIVSNKKGYDCKIINNILICCENELMEMYLSQLLNTTNMAFIDYSK